MMEVARFADVYEAEVAASFLAACGVQALVADRTMATMQPLLQTAVGGIRLLTPVGQAARATELLRMAASGVFAADALDGEKARPVVAFGVVTAVTALLVGHGYAGQPFRPRGRLSAVHLCGLILLSGALVVWIAAWLSFLLGPADVP